MDTSPFPNFVTYLVEKALVKPEHIADILKRVRTKEVKKGSFLLMKGEICKHVFFVEKGLIRFYSIDQYGKEHIIQFAPENWLLSDRSSIYFNKPSEFFIDAVEDTKLVLMDEDFHTFASGISPEFSKHNTDLLQKHIHQLQNRIHLLIGATAETRYLEFIKLYPDLTLRVPQWMIASFLGITPESLSRVRKELASKNFKPQ